MEIKSFEDLKKTGKIKEMIEDLWFFDKEELQIIIDDMFPITDDESNYDSYRGIHDLIAEDIRTYYTENLDSYLSTIEELFEEYDIYFDEDLDDTDIYDIIDEFLLEADDNKVINERIEELKEYYDQKYGSVPYFNEYGNYYGNTDDIDASEEINEIDEEADYSATPEEIPYLEDNVGEVVDVDGIIDIGSRDETFVYLDGEVFIENGDMSHSQIIMKALQEEDKDVEIPNPGDANFYRMTKNRVHSLTDAEDIAFGHIIGDCCFIETLENIDANTVAKTLIDNLSYDIEKVYQYNRSEYLAKRVAFKS